MECGSRFYFSLKQSGEWDQTGGGDISLIDIVNLSIYYTVLLTNRKASLPALESLAAYGKLGTGERRCDKSNWLALVAENKREIQAIVNTFK